MRCLKTGVTLDGEMIACMSVQSLTEENVWIMRNPTFPKKPLLQ